MILEAAAPRDRRPASCSRRRCPVGIVGRREFAQPHFAVVGHLKNMVDHHVHRVASLGEIVHGSPEKGFRLGTRNIGQDDEPRVDSLFPSEVAEISAVLRDEDEVLVDASVQHTMVRLAQATVVPRMENDVIAFVVESEGNLWGQALVEEQAHSPSDAVRTRVGWAEWPRPTFPRVCRKDGALADAS